MLDLTPQGGDGPALGDHPLRLGEIYGFSDIPAAISADLRIPQHWYGAVRALFPAKQAASAMIEIQMLPVPDFPALLLPLDALLSLIARDAIRLQHFPQGSFEQFNRNLRHILTITDELIDLIIDNEELLEDWKLRCLYPALTDRVQATYAWLTAQTDWFDTDPDHLDWILLTRALTDHADHPNDDGDGGVAIPAPGG